MPEINPPEGNKTRILVRGLAEFLAGLHPATAGIAAVYKVAFPSDLDKLVDEWRADVSAKLNDNEEAISKLEQLLRPRLRISETAVAVGMWIAKSTTNAAYEFLEVDTIIEAFPNEPEMEVREAIAELEILGMLEWSHVINGNGHVNIDPSLYFTFDAPARGFNTLEDAIVLSEMALQEQNTISVPDLHKRTGWELRRVNPALSMLLENVDPRRIGRELQPDYVTSYFFLMDEDRFRLRRFVKDNKAVPAAG